MRFVTAALAYAIAGPMGKLVARSAQGRRTPPFRWGDLAGPWFDNSIAVLEDRARGPRPCAGTPAPSSTATTCTRGWTPSPRSGQPPLAAARCPRERRSSPAGRRETDRPAAAVEPALDRPSTGVGSSAGARARSRFSTTSISAGWIQYWPRATSCGGLPEASSPGPAAASGWRPAGRGSGAEDQPGVRVGEQLGEAGGVLHRPAVRRVAVLLAGDDVVDALRDGVPLGEADAGRPAGWRTPRWARRRAGRAADAGSSGCSRLCCTTRASWLATCLSWQWLATSPSAQMPSAVVRWWSSTTTSPSSSTSTPVRSRSRPSALERPAGGDQQQVGVDGAAVGRGARAPRRRTARPSRPSRRAARPTGRCAISVNRSETSSSWARSSAAGAVHDRDLACRRRRTRGRTRRRRSRRRGSAAARAARRARMTVSLVW